MKAILVEAVWVKIIRECRRRKYFQIDFYPV